MWSVEYARPEDAGAILQVHSRAFAETQKKYRVPLPVLQEGEELIAAAIRERAILVARNSDQVIGAVRFRCGGERCRVEVLAVDPAYSHLNVGRSLMARVEAEAISHGAQEIVLDTGLREAAAIDFYLKLGYRPCELLPDERHEMDAVRFRKLLN